MLVILKFLEINIRSVINIYLGKTVGLGDIIYAVNCGGEAHTDIYGIQYQKDTNKVIYLSTFYRIHLNTRE